MSGPPLESTQLVLVAVSAFLASVVGGITGYGTGLLLPPVLVPLIGAEAVVPVIGLSALLTNAGRVMAYRGAVDPARVRLIAAVALPTTCLGAYGYSLLSGPMAAGAIGVALALLVPLRRIARRRGYRLGPRGLRASALGYGALVGGTSGSGIVLITILLASGLSGAAVIATDAAISILLGGAKSAVFVAQGAIGPRLALVALLIGSAALPGAFVARRLSLRLRGEGHILLLDAAVLLGAVLLIRSAVAGVGG